MPSYPLTEKDYRIALKAALVIDARGDALDAMVGIALHWLQRDLTQDAANLLCYVTQHPDVQYDTFDYADERWLALVSHTCPRVIEDARTFVLGKSLTSVASYIENVDLSG